MSGKGTFQAYDPDDWTPRSEDISGETVAPLEMLPAVLATDGADDAPGPLPARVVTEDEREDDRLRDYAVAMALEESGNPDRAEHLGKTVSYWRRSGHDRGVIAAFVRDTLKVRLPEIDGSFVKYLNAIFNKRAPGDRSNTPPVPPEFALPPVAGPAIHRASDDFKARRRQYEANQIAKREREKAERAAEAAEAGERVAAMMGRGTLLAIGGGR